MEQVEKRAEVIRLRMAWVEARRRELWRRMDGLEEPPVRTRRAEAAEIDPVTVYPLD